MNKLLWKETTELGVWRGYLASDPATTLALIKTKGKDYELTSAFTRDDAEPRRFAKYEDAQNKVQSEIAEWVWRHAFEFIPSEIDCRNKLAAVRQSLESIAVCAQESVDKCRTLDWLKTEMSGIAEEARQALAKL